MAKTRDRRDFLKQSAAIGVGLAIGVSSESGSTRADDPPATQPRAGKSVAGLAAPKLETIRLGIIGCGGRGTGDMQQFLACEGVKVLAVCDIVDGRANHAADIVAKRGQPKPETYARGPEDFRRLCDRDDLDAVMIATPWEWHVPMCVDAMKKGKHAFVEVPAAVTVEECWELVDTAEGAQKHCMIMENCCYGPSELMALNMVRKGLLGDLLHGECAYIHDLRGLLFSKGSEGDWRTAHSVNRNGNLYPTHGLGPVAQYMSINRGDCFDYLVSMSSPSLGMQKFAVEHPKNNHPLIKSPFKQGDMNVSLIKTTNGRTIVVQHDTTSPRPYDRINLISGTKGTFRSYPDRICIEGRSKGDNWEGPDSYKDCVHPLWKKLEEDAKKNGGHGGMDFVMTWRIVQCLREGLPLDIDVYDTASWSVVSALSEKSVANGSMPVKFPDFTRGGWKTTPPLGIVE